MDKPAWSEFASDVNGGDLPADKSTPATLTLGTAVEGDIGGGADSDWYAVNLVAGQSYYFTLTGAGGDALAMPYLTVYGYTYLDIPQPQYVVFNNGPNGSAWFSYTAIYTGTFFLGASSQGGGEGHYSIRAVQLPTDAVGNWTDTTTQLAAGPAVAGVLEGMDDRDFYLVNLTAGQTYQFTLNGTASGDIAALNYGTLTLYLMKNGTLTQAAQDGFNGAAQLETEQFFYTAESGGQYYLAVTTVGQGLYKNHPWEQAHGGAYAVGFATPAPDIDAGGPAAATAGQPVSSILAGSADTDTFTYNLIAGYSYSFYFDRPSSNTLAIVGHTATGSDYFAAGFSFTATTTGAFDLVVSGGQRDYDYTVLSYVQAADVAGDATTTAVLVPGQTMHGFSEHDWEHSSPDTDWYAVQVKAGMTYVFKSDSPTLSLVAADGTPLAYEQLSQSGGVRYLATMTQTVYLQSRDFGGYSLDDYVITSAEVQDREGNSQAGATRLGVGQPVQGVIDYEGDVDWFTFDVIAGYTYSLSLVGVSDHPGDATLSLVSQAYIPAPVNGYAQDLRFEATVTGSFYLKVASHSWIAGPYQVGISVVDTVASTPATSGQLTVGQSVSGEIYQPMGSDFNGWAASESDWYAVMLEAGQAYAFDAVASGSSLVSPLLGLRDGDGAVLPPSQVSGSGGHLQFVASSSGIYYVTIETSGHTGGAYTISAAKSNDIGQLNTGAGLAVGGTQRSTIDGAGDSDWFRVQLTAGQTYLFLATPDGAGALGDATVGLANANGDMLASSSQGPGAHDAGLRWTASVTGTYYVAVGGQGNATGAYAVTASAVAPANPVTAIESGLPVSGHSVRVYFATSGQSYGGHTATESWLNADVTNLMTTGTAAWSGVADVAFTRVNDPSQADVVMVLAASVPDLVFEPATAGGPRVIAMSPNWDAADVLTPGTIGYGELLKVTGYGLGLVHPDTWSATHQPLDPIVGPAQYSSLDQAAFTIMYSGTVLSNPGPAGWLGGWASGPMALDVAAVQHLYGAVAANTGDTVYTLPAQGGGQSGARAIWDTAGTDTIMAAANADASVIDLRPATLANAVGGGGYISYTWNMGGGFTIANGVTIENATGNGGRDTLIGNAGNNVLTGNGGDDFMWGGLGNDSLDGGAGSDTIDFSLAAQGVKINLGLSGAQDTGEGMDTLSGIENFIGSAYNDVVTAASATMQVAGGAGVDTLVFTGNYADYTITRGWQDSGQVSGGGLTLGFADVETLKFADRTVRWSGTRPQIGGDMSAVVLAGGTYVLTTQDLNASDAESDPVTFDAWNISNGEILVNGVVVTSFTAAQLAAGQVSFHHVASPYASPYAPGFFAVASDGITDGNTSGTFVVQVITGQVVNDGDAGHVVNGTAGVDALYGNGGDDRLNGNAGDLLDGGDGNDLVIGGAGGTFDGGAGNDTLSLAGYETNYLSVSLETAGTSIRNIENLIGSAYNDFLTGSAIGNLLDGAGGEDTLTGGKGDDTYVVDNALDKLVENNSEGHDVAYASVSYSLAETKSVEDLFLTGTASIDATGNYLRNILTGNAGNNRLDGGGAGDQMTGGLGNDTYVVDNAMDVIVELAGEGNDTVITVFDHVLAATFENLVLIGATAAVGTGNASANSLTGNDAANVLTGLGGNDWLDGGLGADSLAGGLGDDTYVIDNAGDVITELAGEGSDTVVAAFTTTLAANLENLTLAGSAAINGTGHAGDNRLTGNAGANVMTGLAGGDLLDGRGGVDMLVGGAGNDTYVVDMAGDVVKEVAGEGVDLVNASASYVLGANVENLTLTGAGHINGTGNGLVNSITGNSGSNVMDGLGGADSLVGGLGNDTYVIDNAGDIVTELASQGTDTVQASINFVLGANIERLTLTGTANTTGTGNGLANEIRGNSGNNRLDGGTGADTLIGGLGNDTYTVDDAGDKAAEMAGEGLDQVNANVSFALGSNVENLQLSGSAANGTGNVLNNVIWGTDGANRLDGMGGADKLLGGFGDDTYIVDNVADQATDVAGGGIDIVLASNSHILSQYVENLTLTGSANITGTGNAMDNVLIGNAGNNKLTGGAGADSMTGGAGHDTYYVDNIADVITEAASQGVDLVHSLVSYTLSANVDNLFLEGPGNLNGTGNAINNLIIGNGGNNILDGAGGVDKLFGGLGDDTYYVDNVADSAKDEVGGGTDIVFSSVGCVLTTNVENLTLTGTANSNGTGNALANILTGNSGNNKLDGGAGNDVLTGGLGSDIFLLGASSGQDTITDYTVSDYLNLKAWSHGTAYGGGITITQAGADVLIDLGGGNSVTLLNTLKSDVTGHIYW